MDYLLMPMLDGVTGKGFACSVSPASVLMGLSYSLVFVPDKTGMGSI